MAVLGFGLQEEHALGWMHTLAERLGGRVNTCANVNLLTSVSLPGAFRLELHRASYKHYVIVLVEEQTDRVQSAWSLSHIAHSSYHPDNAGYYPYDESTFRYFDMSAWLNDPMSPASILIEQIARDMALIMAGVM